MAFDKIFIRVVNLEGNWGSYSLQEILDGGFAGQIAQWFYGKIGELVGYQEGAIVTKEHAEAMVALLESLGVTVYKLK